MKSPVTGKEMKLVKEPRKLNFKNEDIEIIYHSYLCEESGEQFTTGRLDEINILQVRNLYAETHEEKSTNKKRVWIDMDGVLCDFYGTAKKRILENPKREFPQGEYGFFENLPALPDAIESYHKLCELYDVRILTRASEMNINSYSGKAFWVYKNLGFDCQVKMVFSGDKAIAIGDYLIDDQTNANQENFTGTLIKFGSTEFPDWKVVYEHLLNAYIKSHTIS